MTNGLKGWLKTHKEFEKKKKEEAHKKLRDLAKQLGYEVSSLDLK